MGQKNHPDKLRLARKNAPPLEFEAGFKRVKKALSGRQESTYLLSTSVDDNGMHPRDNLYMWGHYGSGHRGIAIEFNAANLADSLLTHSDPEGKTGLNASNAWVKVDYKTQVTPLSYESYLDLIIFGRDSVEGSENQALKGITSFLDQTLRTKHTVWAMEREWRLIWSSDSGKDVYHCPISDCSINGVYLGLRIEDAVKQDVLSIAELQMPGIPIWRAIKAKGFSLEWIKEA